MLTSQGSRTLRLLLGATLLAAAPVGAQRPAAERTATLVSLRQEAERAMAELREANGRLMRYREALRLAPAVGRAQRDTLLELDRLATVARMRAVEASARHDMTLRLTMARSARAAEQAARAAAGPQGYFGVAVSQPSSPRPGSAPAENPRVATVEPGSPAAKAGLRAGDHLVRVGEVVLRDGGDLAPVLRPGNVVRVIFERDGRRQEADVRIEPRPLSYRSGLSVTVRELPAEQTTIRVIPAPDVQVLTSIGPEAVAALGPGAGRRTIPDGAASFVISSRRTSIVAGAEVTQLDDKLREATGATRGLYVLAVHPGLHAGRAGVRQGDVLLRAGDVTFETPVDFMRAIGARIEAHASDLRLDLLRDRKVLTVELKW